MSVVTWNGQAAPTALALRWRRRGSVVVGEAAADLEATENA
ncbi:MAG: hypothetical protein ACYDBH_22090 [Acidobacteriaceae bacterium]